MATRNASTRSSNPSRGASSAKNQIVAMLKADHKKVKKAFKDFEKMDPQEDPQECQALVEHTLGEIEVHAELEEQLFYPAARGAIEEEDLIDEAEVEHMTAKVLIQQLKGMGAQDEKFAATFKVLGEYLKHHIEEEEGEMFKQLTASGADWRTVLEEMQSQRERLMQEKGIAPEEEESDSGQAVGAARTSAPGAGMSRGESQARPQASSKPSKSSPSEKE